MLDPFSTASARRRCCYEPINLAAIADQPQTRTRRTRQPRPSQKRCVTHSQLPKSSYGPRPAP
jgi:hypothetical protein